MENIFETDIERELIEEMKTLGDVNRYLVSLFELSDVYFGHGADNSFQEAQQLLAPMLGLEFEELSLFAGSALSLRERKKIAELASKRIREKMPVPYLTGVSYFAGMKFAVNKNVLIPRSPIAELIESDFAGYLPESADAVEILDMCTGSGCIAIAAASRLADRVVAVDAVDISQDALEVCFQNVAAHNLEQVVYPIMSDLFENLGNAVYDLIIANPPYVDESDLAVMPEEYSHEPSLALGSGADGLDLTRKILSEASAHLKPGAYLICEVGNSMYALIEQYPDVPFEWIEFKNGGMGVFAISKEDLDKSGF